MDMYILLKDLKFYAHHGVDPQETTVGAYFTVNLKIKTGFTNAMQTDALEGTISYADIYNAVKEEMQQPSQLLEHASGRILQRLFRDFPSITGIHLELIKDNPPMGAECSGAGVEIYQERGDIQ